MRGSGIVWSFLVIVAAFYLWTLPITTAIYNFRTDLRTDAFTVTTAAGVTSANTTLLKPIYSDDTQTIEYLSSISEVPVFSTYNSTTRQLTTSGLTEAETRTLYVSYDIDALTAVPAFSTLMDWFPFIWYIFLTAFPIVALVAIVRG